MNAVHAFRVPMLWTVKAGSGFGERIGGGGVLPEKSDDPKYDHSNKPLRQD